MAWFTIIAKQNCERVEAKKHC